ncbi:SDR family oxidoreductase [Acidiphilium sp. PA]|uniref:SDR family NAD(P)-dependent oxidoreductase n=1 Tax=Acidiphilium sp. PA TaxID=2871705 RepID=UPI002244697D|nr:SDR family NAD(P)-dependent oxidoreductase [Acidiphilium sp. PA]MCW8306587.1 SDR family oxidoreductase [Acidiphilium sp. PA]
MNQQNRFDQQCAVVTGGAAGIGLAVAGRIIAEGGRVAIWDRNPADIDAAVAKFGDQAMGVPVDVTDWAAIEQAAQTTDAAFGHIDILIASAGITGPNATTWEYPVADWQQVFAVNLHGVFHANKAVVPYMLARDTGRIVNIASIAGKEGNPNASAYSASKAAVIGLTKSLGKELAKSGITVNCVTPAAVRTAIFDQMTQQHIDFMLSKIPMGRFGTVDEIAALVCWLASRECSFTTGGVFDISGGRATY